MSGLDLKRVHLSAGEIAYAEEGDGPPVLLLHGFPTSSHMWRDLLPMLAPRFRAIAPDLLGYGASEKPDGVPLGAEGQTPVIRELLAALGVERFAVVGHDLGGAVAQLLAKDPGVEAMVLLDAVPSGHEPIQAVRELQALDAVDPKRLVRGGFEIGIRQRQLSEEDMDAYIAPWREDPAALERAVHAIQPWGPPIEELLAGIEAPSIVIWGEDDVFLSPKLGERMWEALEDCAIALLPGCGHFVTEDAPETVLPLVSQFLRSRYLGLTGHDHDTGPVTVDLGISFTRPEPAEELVDE